MTKEQAMKEYEYTKIELVFYQDCYKCAIRDNREDTLAQSYAESVEECESYMDFLRTQIYKEN